MKAVRKCKRSSDGYDSGDIDELVQMFQAALTWDGNHCSKSSRDHLIEHGYAYRIKGLTALTGKGKIAALLCWPMPRVWFRLWRRYRRIPKPVFNRVDQKSAVR
jgi:hypothetical protein